MAALALDSATSAGGGAKDFSTALYAFLDRNLAPAMYNRLYTAPASCLSIFRLLPITSRHIVLNMLWYEETVRIGDVALWVRERKSEGGDKGERRHLSASLTALSRLHIISPRVSPGQSATDATELDMNPKFRQSFRSALTGGGTAGSFGVAALAQDEEVTVQFLDQHAETQWETIQHFMVGSDAGAKKPSEGVLKLLVRSELMYSPTQSMRQMRITSKGFQFLLEDVNTQLWDLLLSYLEESQDLVETIGFLFMLGSLELGRAYLTDPLSDSQLGVLRDLADYGLVYRPSPSSKLFYPTRLATTLTSSAPPLVSSRHSNEEKGFIVLETNYKLYAYTSNPLQIAVLGLFALLKTRFANFVTGHITRDSIRRGLANGITANQIISYLASRAHPQMRAQAGADEKLLPTTVVDQIRLWEHERRRIQTTDGYLYDDFSSQHDYELVLNYAKEVGVVLWESEKARKVFVTADGHAQVREFIKRRMAAAQAEAAAGGGAAPVVASRLAKLPSFLALFRPVWARTPPPPLVLLRRPFASSSCTAQSQEPAQSERRRTAYSLPVSRSYPSEAEEDSVLVPWSTTERFLKSICANHSELADLRHLDSPVLADDQGGFSLFKFANLFGEPVVALSARQFRRHVERIRRAKPSLRANYVFERWRQLRMFTVPLDKTHHYTFKSAQDLERQLEAAEQEQHARREERRAAFGPLDFRSEPAAEGPSRSKPVVKRAGQLLADTVSAKRSRSTGPSPSASASPVPGFSDIVASMFPSPSSSTSSPSSSSMSTLPSQSSSIAPSSTPEALPSPQPRVTPEAAALLEAKRTARKQFELSTVRHAYERASKEGGAAFVSLDVEFWERDHDVLLEFGWSVVEFSKRKDGSIKARREDQHAVVRENARFRNGRFAPDARDHFDFGRTLTLPQQTLYQLLSALLSTLSSTQPVYLIFHDPRADLRSLQHLGFNPDRDFTKDLQKLAPALSGSPAPGFELEGRVWVLDTQRLFEAWTGRKCQIGLEKACTEMDVPTKRLHNAGNDSHYTLDLFERLMDPSRTPSPDSPLLLELDRRAAAAAQKKAEAAKERALRKAEQEAEQEALGRAEMNGEAPSKSS